MQYFRTSEFRCKCGCGTTVVETELLDRLEIARGIAGIPFVVTSGYRCPAHNERVGGKSNSAHVKGLAADIRTHSSGDRYVIMLALLDAGFTRIGVARSFIHVDCDKSLPQNVMWEY